MVATAHDDGAVGVYLHLPFCDRVCPYCDFAVVAARVLPAADEARYVQALLTELEKRAPVFSGRTLASVYWGGGTPSLFQPESIARVLEAVEDLFADAQDLLETKLESWQEEENPKSEWATKKYQIYLEVKEKAELYKKIKQELKLLLFNSRKLITGAA